MIINFFLLLANETWTKIVLFPKILWIRLQFLYDENIHRKGVNKLICNLNLAIVYLSDLLLPRHNPLIIYLLVARFQCFHYHLLKQKHLKVVDLKYFCIKQVVNKFILVITKINDFVVSFN